MTPSRERTYEAIYAAAFVREIDRAFADSEGELYWHAHNHAKHIADAWLEVVQAAEGEQG